MGYGGTRCEVQKCIDKKYEKVKSYVYNDFITNIITTAAFHVK